MLFFSSITIFLTSYIFSLICGNPFPGNLFVFVICMLSEKKLTDLQVFIVYLGAIIVCFFSVCEAFLLENKWYFAFSICYFLDILFIIYINHYTKDTFFESYKKLFRHNKNAPPSNKMNVQINTSDINSQAEKNATSQILDHAHESIIQVSQVKQVKTTPNTLKISSTLQEIDSLQTSKKSQNGRNINDLQKLQSSFVFSIENQAFKQYKIKLESIYSVQKNDEKETIVLINDETVVFNKTTHSYTVNGIYVPSVTHLIKTFGPKIYENVPTSVLKKAATLGTNMHETIENYEVFGLDDKQSIELQNYKRKKRYYNIIPIGIEIIVVIHGNNRKPICAGRLDFLLFNEFNNKLSIMDLKRTSRYYPETVAAQLNLYKLGFEQCFSLPINELICFRLRDNIADYRIVSTTSPLAQSIIKILNLPKKEVTSKATAQKTNKVYFEHNKKVVRQDETHNTPTGFSHTSKSSNQSYSAITTRNQNDNMKAKKRYNTSSYYKAIYSDKTCRKGDIIFLIDNMTPTTYIVRNNSSYLNIETHGGYKLGEEIIHTDNGEGRIYAFYSHTNEVFIEVIFKNNSKRRYSIKNMNISKK